jgi:hypothetical protein
VTVRDSHFERNGRQGIAITAGEDIRVERNIITQVRRSTFDIEPNSADWGARRVTISDNDIGPGRLTFLAGHGAAGTVDDVTVVGNRLHGKNMTVSLVAPAERRRTNFKLIDNVSDAPFGSAGPAIAISGYDGVTIRDNVLPLAKERRMTAVGLTATCDVVIENNQFVDAVKDVQGDGYDCGPSSVGPSSSSTTSRSSSTTSRSSSSNPSPTIGGQNIPHLPAPGAPAATGADGALSKTVEKSATTNKGQTTGTGSNSGGRGEEAAALADPGGPLVDPAPIERPDSNDHSLWVLVVGAVVSTLVLVPLSRRGHRKR